MRTTRRCRSANSKGFTLIEVLVAIAVLGISMSLVYGVFQSVFGVVDHVESTAAHQERASVLFTQLHRDIAGLYKGPTGSFKAESEIMKSGGTPFLQFTTTSGLAFDPHQPPVPIQWVGYHLIPSGNGINYSLYRSETAYKFGIDNDAAKAAGPLLICEYIRDLRITYTDQYGGDLDLWQARSSSVGDKPEDDLFPTAMQIDIELAKGPGNDAETKRFHYSVYIRPARLIKPEMADQG